MRKLIALSLVVFFSACTVSHLDTRVVNEINQEIGKQAGLGPMNLTVDSSGGVVVLSGDVASEESRTRIERLAEGISGVETVHNKLRVNTAIGGVGGNELVAAVQANIKSHKNELGRHNLLISSRGTQVILDGHVDTDDDARIISEAAANTPGVTAVTNNLAVKYSLSDDAIAERVRTTLAALPELPATKIQVSSNAGIVTLRGSLSNHREVDQSISNALMVPGVKDVRSELLINGRPYSGLGY